MSKLYALHAFYRNDEPHGVGITITHEVGDLDGMFAMLKESYDAMWEEAEEEDTTDELIADLFSQLQGIGASKPITDVKKMLMVIGNVYLLEKVGALTTDDYNGMSYVWDNTQ